MKTRLAALVLLTLALAGCSSTDDEPSSSDTGTSTAPGVVTRADFGADWPLTVDGGTLHCDGSGGFGDAYIEVGGETYALNGSAKASHADIDPIWADDPEMDGLKKDIGVLIDAALELCD